jgi:cis-3-alkyl-4-acyloxetan-2-one decarboxylase
METPEILIEGDGPRTIVLVHGWPDTLRVWDSTVQALRHEARCVRFTWPGMDPHRGSGKRRAWSMREMLQCLDHVVRSTSPDAPVTLLLHDWGCLFGYQYAMRNTDRVERVIGVDIGDAGSRYHRQEMSWRAMGLTLGYQLWLAAAWRIGGSLGNRMARWMAARLRAPSAPQDISASQGWPYAVQWFGVAGGFGRLRTFSPTVPMLFIYGQRKPMSFHSRNWAERIASRPGSRVLGLSTGHWVMLQRPAEFHMAIANWLRETDSVCRSQQATRTSQRLSA